MRYAFSVWSGTACYSFDDVDIDTAIAKTVRAVARNTDKTIKKITVEFDDGMVLRTEAHPVKEPA